MDTHKLKAEGAGRWLTTRADAVRAEWRALDSDVLAVRVTAAVFFLGGVLSLLALVWLPNSWSDPRYDWRISTLTMVIGAIGPLLPWARWPRRAQIAYALAALLIVAVGGASFGGAITPYIALLPLPFVLVGFTQPPGTSAVLLPFTAVALVIAAHSHWTHEFVGMIVIALPLSVGVGEAIAQMTKRQSDAEGRVGRLLDAVRVLAREDDERHGAQVIASLAVELLDADAAAVLIGNGAHARRYQHRAWFGHPALGDAVPYVVDARELRESVPPGVLRFYQDASASPLLAPHGHRARSALVMSLPGERRPIGVLVVLWGQRRRYLPTGARQAAELLSQEAGRMLSRLHQTAVLTRDAETDPLTQLANRRTYNRALATLQPGDAIVIVDLDHFKSVNDRFGHDEGDRTLRVLAKCLRKVSRQVDCVARYGGEEFALVLADSSEEGARAAMHRLRAAWQSTEPLTTFSAGIAIHEAGTTPHQTLLRADAALYRAKEHGRNRDEFAKQHELVLP
ncbi:MAG: diguanylate cyclase [Actinomycetia bacterium]|nr:diguanylate cyclase [Actinomycetes bacterium]